MPVDTYKLTYNPAIGLQCMKNGSEIGTAVLNSDLLKGIPNDINPTQLALASHESVRVQNTQEWLNTRKLSSNK